LARVYLHTWQVTGEPLCRTITEGTLDYVVPEMTSPGGGFCSTQDADRGAGGEEGASSKSVKRWPRPGVGFPRCGSRASIQAAMEIAIVGEPDADDTRSSLAVA
jgi:hypothetical protein